MKPGAIFRCVVPDLEGLARTYLEHLDQGDDQASVAFVQASLLGQINRPRGLRGVMSSVFGNSDHLWMWDEKSLEAELKKAGFVNGRICKFNDSADPMFKLVESEPRVLQFSGD
ncbi:MAG: methyltransferase type 11 [Bacteroidota bacterium]